MAVISFAANAPLSGFWAWAAAQNMLPLCQPSGGNSLDLLAKKLTWGTYAEAGDSVRFSAFLASGSAVIDYGGQWMDDAGVYQRYNRTLSVTAAASPVRSIIPASPGWYRDAAISLQTAGIAGQTLYVTQELGRTNGGSFAPIAMLAQGGLTSTAPVVGGGGGGGGGGCCAGGGSLITTPGFVNAEGFDFVIQVIPIPAGKQLRLTEVRGTYNIGALVLPLRRVFLAISMNSGPFYEIYASADQPMSSAREYTWLLGAERGTVPGTDDEIMPLPPDLWGSTSITVVADAVNRSGSENWGTVAIRYELRQA